MAEDAWPGVSPEGGRSPALPLPEELERVSSLLPGMIYRFRRDPAGAYSLPFVTQRCEELFGLPPQALESDFNPALARVHPEDRERLVASIEASAVSFTPWGSEFRVQHPERGEIWIEARSVPVRESDGGVLWHGYAQDVSARRRAEVALADELDRRRALLEGSRDGVVVVGSDARVLEANRRFAELLGYLPDEVLQLHLWDWDRCWTREDLLERLANLGAEGVLFETQMQRRDGALVDVEVSSSAVMVGGQKLAFCVCRDISERKRGEAALRRREAEYREVFQRAAGGLAEVDVVTGQILLANAALASLTGYAEEALVGLPIYALNLPEDQAQARACLAGYQSGELGDEPGVEGRLLRRDGREVWVRARVSRLPPVAGLGARLLVSLEDIDERKRQERLGTLQHDLALALSACRSLEEGLELCLRAGLEAGGLDAGGVYLIEEESGDLVLGPYRGLGPAFVSAVGRLGPKTPHARLLADARSVFTTYSHIPFEVASREIEEGLRFAAILPLVAEDRVMGCLNLASHELDDVPAATREALETVAATASHAVARLRAEAALRTREAELEQARKLEAIGQLAGGVAHDFNNILASMMMNIALLEQSFADDPESLESLRELEADARRAARLTEQLLSFSRRSALRLVRLDLNDVVEGMLDMLRRIIGEAYALSFRPMTRLPIRADASRVQQIVMNLVVNARDAMPKGGRIVVRTGRETGHRDAVRSTGAGCSGPWAVLTVTDTGAGMNPETARRVFEPFFTTKVDGRGTGLGLATVHGIAAQHGGGVEVSTRLGLGSTFRVYFPIAHDEGDVTDAESPAGRAERAGRARPAAHVLVVEDDEPVRTLMARSLRRLGYEVTEARSGPEALHLVKKGDFGIDVALADMVMPGGMSGLELVDALRALQPKLPAVIVSGYSTEIVASGTPSGMGIRFLAKPFRIEALAAEIEAALAEPHPATSFKP